MKKILFIVILGIQVLLIGCYERVTKQEARLIGMPLPKKLAPYTALAGFESKQLALSTNEHNVKGLALVQYRKNEKDTTKYKIWQHPSWIKLGYMGSITSSRNGTAYTAPIPFVNTLEADINNLNKIYKVDDKTGELKPFIDFPKIEKGTSTMPFAVLGIFYDDHANILYASNVTGSTAKEENGVIYAIDVKSKKIIDVYKATDAFGLAVIGFTGEKKLYFGSARKPDIYSLELSKTGQFIGKAKLEFSLSNLGPRGNDKARRIRIDKDGTLYVFGLDFSYNLAAQTEKPETVYAFVYDENEKKWIFGGLQ